MFPLMNKEPLGAPNIKLKRSLISLVVNQIIQQICGDITIVDYTTCFF